MRAPVSTTSIDVSSPKCTHGFVSAIFMILFVCCSCPTNGNEKVSVASLNEWYPRSPTEITAIKIRRYRESLFMRVLLKNKKEHFTALSIDFLIAFAREKSQSFSEKLSFPEPFIFLKDQKYLLQLIADSFYHFCNGWIEWEPWHLCIYYDEHISSFSSFCSSFSWYFEFGSWFCTSLYFESEDFVIDSFHWDRGIIEEIEPWYFDGFCDIKILDFFFWFFLLCFLSSGLFFSTSEKIPNIELKSPRLLSSHPTKLWENILVSWLRSTRLSRWLWSPSTKWISPHTTKWISLGRAELVIALPFCFVPKSLVGFIDFFEFCLSFFISLIFIRMVFHCLFFIGLFYLSFGCRFVYSEWCVVVFVCHILYI